MLTRRLLSLTFSFHFIYLFSQIQKWRDSWAIAVARHRAPGGAAAAKRWCKVRGASRTPCTAATRAGLLTPTMSVVLVDGRRRNAKRCS